MARDEKQLKKAGKERTATAKQQDKLELAHERQLVACARREDALASRLEKRDEDVARLKTLVSDLKKRKPKAATPKPKAKKATRKSGATSVAKKRPAKRTVRKAKKKKKRRMPVQSLSVAMIWSRKSREVGRISTAWSQLRT